MRPFRLIAVLLVVGLIQTFCLLPTSLAGTLTLKWTTNDIFAKPPAEPNVGGQEAFSWMAEEIKKRTGGEVQVEIYWGAVLGEETTTLKMVPQGTIHMQPVSGSNLARFAPEFGLFSVGYLFKSYEHFEKVMNDERVFKRLQQVVRDKNVGFQYAGMGITGTRNLYNRKKAVSKLEDLKGMKMRVMASPIEHEVWSTLGMLPANIVSTEIYTSLQSGVVDASESSVSYIIANKYYEVAPNISLTMHQFSTHAYVIGDRTLKLIPAQHVPAVLSVLRETGPRQIRATARLQERDLVKMRALPKVTVTEPDTRPFIEKLRPVQDKVAKQLKMEDVLAVIRELQ